MIPKDSTTDNTGVSLGGTRGLLRKSESGTYFNTPLAKLFDTHNETPSAPSATDFPVREPRVALSKCGHRSSAHTKKHCPMPPHGVQDELYFLRPERVA